MTMKVPRDVAERWAGTPRMNGLDQMPRETESRSLNLNDSVRVRIRNGEGLAVLMAYCSGTPRKTPEQVADVLFPGWRDGVIKTQMHAVIEIFGPYIRFGRESPIHTELEVLRWANS